MSKPSHSRAYVVVNSKKRETRRASGMRSALSGPNKNGNGFDVVIHEGISAKWAYCLYRDRRNQRRRTEKRAARANGPRGILLKLQRMFRLSLTPLSDNLKSQCCL